METIATLTMNPTLDIAAEVKHLSPGQKLRSASRHYYPGGGGINIARVIHGYGADVTAVFPAGGATGDKLDSLLDKKGMAHRTIPIKGETRETFLVRVTDSGESYHVVMPGPELTEQEVEQCLATLKNLQPPPRYLIASGSLPSGLNEDFHARLARFANSCNIRLILDTSGVPLGAALREGVYLIRCNRHEFRDLAGEDLAEDEATRRRQISATLARGGMQILIVTLGDGGAFLVTPEVRIRVRPPEVKVASVTGAGDSFVALLTLKLAQGRDLKEALCYAVAAAAAAVTTEGNSLCRREDVERLYQQMLSDTTAVQIENEGDTLTL